MTHGTVCAAIAPSSSSLCPRPAYLETAQGPYCDKFGRGKHQNRAAYLVAAQGHCYDKSGHRAGPSALHPALARSSEKAAPVTAPLLLRFPRPSSSGHSGRRIGRVHATAEDPALDRQPLLAVFAGIYSDTPRKGS